MKYFAQVVDENQRILRSEELTAEQVIDLLASPIEPVVENEVVEEVVKTAGGGKAKKAPKENPNPEPAVKGKNKCGMCGAVGHIARSCKIVVKGPGQTVVPGLSNREILTSDEYDKIRYAMKDREFMSGEYALTNGLSPREVNRTVRSANYKEYLNQE